MIKEQEKWDTWVENNTDPYGKACVDIAREVMILLDANDEPLIAGYDSLQTPHGLISQANKTTDSGGITGFMAGCVAQMISECHSRGEEFRKIWNAPYNPDAEGVVNPALMTIETNDEASGE